MKTLLLWAAVAAVAIVHAAGGLRVDVRGLRSARIREIAARPPLSWQYFPQYLGTEKESSAVMISSPLGADWRRFEFSFVPENDGRFTLSFHVQGVRRQVVPALVDDIQVSGAVLKNGGFETAEEGRPAHWRQGKAAALVTDGSAAEGKNCMRVAFRSGTVSQQISVSAGQPVTVSFLARLADPVSATEDIVHEPQPSGGKK